MITAKFRELNFELLRVISIISIVVGHLGAAGPGIPNPLCWLGDVNCFVLISGYFMISGRFRAIRFVRLAIETVFYCFVISLIFYAFNPSIGWGALVKSVFPFGPHAYSYWFINKFLALLLLQPFLSKLAGIITRRQYKILLIVLMMLNSEFVPGFPFSCLFDNGWSLPWFITLFMIGGYVRLYNPLTKIKNWGGYWLVSAIVMEVAMQRFGDVFNLQYNQWFFFAKSFSMFMFVRSIRIASQSVIGRIVQFIAPNILSVYVIHNQHLMITWLTTIGSAYAMTYTVTTHFLWWCIYGVGVIIGCTLIDKARVLLFKICGITNLMNKLSDKVDKRLALNVI